MTQAAQHTAQLIHIGAAFDVHQVANFGPFHRRAVFAEERNNIARCELRCLFFACLLRSRTNGFTAALAFVGHV